MAFCEECGNRLPENAKVCDMCGTFVKEDYSEKADTFRKMSFDNRNIDYSYSKDDELILAENEQIIKEYLCSNVKLGFFKANGYLTVTNKRLIFNGRATGSRISSEVNLNSVSGLDCYYGLNIKILFVILAVASVGYGIVGIKEHIMVPFIGLLVGAFFLFFGVRKAFYLSIYSSEANESSISMGQGATTLFGRSAGITLNSKPTPDTDVMLNELGALVQDIKTLGDHAIAKWKE